MFSYSDGKSSTNNLSRKMSTSKVRISMNQRIVDMLDEICRREFEGSQSSMARSIGLSQPALSRIMRGDTVTPQIDNAVKIAKKLGVSLDAIYFDIDPKMASPRSSSFSVDEIRLIEGYRIAKVREPIAADALATVLIRYRAGEKDRPQDLRTRDTTE
jgi:transcriptional regulator with XRE-family HTH domain